MNLDNYIQKFSSSLLSRWTLEPWQITSRSEEIVSALLASETLDGYAINDGIAVHQSTYLEDGCVLKAPLIIGPNCYVAAGAYLRGGNWIESDCIFGPGAELKSSFVFSHSKLAHFNFVGDSIIGEGVNLEAGSIVCNYRNERADKEIRVRTVAGVSGVGVDKFGAVLGDRSRLGANAVVAPGALLPPDTVIRRTALFDHEVSTLDTDG